MEGRRVKAPARLAVVVRSFLGSRLERELLTQAFALASRGPSTLRGEAQEEEPRPSSAGTHLPLRRKGA
jgi:hypothetical protein